MVIYVDGEMITGTPEEMADLLKEMGVEFKQPTTPVIIPHQEDPYPYYNPQHSWLWGII